MAEISRNRGGSSPRNVSTLLTARLPIYGILEVKSDVFWDGPGSDARVKADAAREWVRTVNPATATVQWEFAIVLDQDAIVAASLEALRTVALLRYPDAIETLVPQT